MGFIPERLLMMMMMSSAIITVIVSIDVTQPQPSLTCPQPPHDETYNPQTRLQYSPIVKQRTFADSIPGAPDQ